jgi:hypothetical protein
MDAHGNSSSASFVVDVVDRTAPTLAVPDALVADAASPAGAILRYTVTATDSVDGPIAPVCSPSSEATFAIGDTTATCTASDQRGNTSPASTFLVHVKGAREQLADLLKQVRSWGLRGHMASRVRGVTRALAQHNRACGLLTAFDKELRGSRGERLTSAQRGTLRGELSRIGRVVGCTSAEHRHKTR